MKVCLFFTIVLGLSLLSSSVLAVVCDVTANSGSAADIQAAVNQVAAAGGGNVCILAGTFDFATGSWQTVNIPDTQNGISIFGAPTQRDSNGQVISWETILRMPFRAPRYVNFFNVDGVKSSFRLSDIQLVGYREISPWNNPDDISKQKNVEVWRGVRVSASNNVRIDHCYFKNVCGEGIQFLGSNGVIDHNRLVNDKNVYVTAPYAGCTVHYGVATNGLSNLWETNIQDVLGKYTSRTVFIEDNYFEGWRHAVASNVGAHYVFRYNVERKNGYGTVDAHGHEGASPLGTRAIEVYNNSFTDTVWGDFAIQQRGGAGIYFNNTFDGYGVTTSPYDYSATLCLIQYGDDNYPAEQIHDTYYWNNTVIPPTADVWDAGWGSHNPVYENEHFFLRAPSQALDGFTYTPYTYPHPLTLEGPTTTTIPITTTIGTTTTTTPTTTVATTTTPTTTSTTTTIPAGQVSISGQLINTTRPVQANITIYNQGTSQVNATDTTDSGGNYGLGVWPGVYDLQYDIFYIPNLFIKLISLNILSDVQDVVNYVNSLSNGLSFTVDITEDQEIQIYSEEKPKTVKVNGVQLTEATLPLSTNEWFYDSIGQKLYMKISPLPITTTTTVPVTTTTISTTTTTFTTTTVPATTTTTTTSTTTTIPPETGLVGYWTFDDCTATDASGNGNDGTIYGATCESTDCHSPSCLSFDGVDDYVSITDSNSLDLDNITLSSWIHVKSYLNDQRIISKEYGTTQPFSIYTLLLSEAGEKKLEFRLGLDGQDRQIVTSDADIPLNEWTYVAATFDGSAVILYINGQVNKADYTISGTIRDNDRPVLIGASEFWTPRFFNGTIDEVRIYNRSLTAEEILAHASA